ncbi:MAG: hypothetical protein K5762_05685 [Bacilli bacterium]|nr:hypothetical protein [Bacilli bacterium]
MANNVSGFTKKHSFVARDYFICKDQLCEYSQKAISTLSNVKKDTVATLTINYELFQMGKNKEVISTYQPFNISFLVRLVLKVN